MAGSVGLLSNRVKKIPSTQVDDDRYRFLGLQDSEPDLGVPDQEGNFLVSNSVGQRSWSKEISYNQNNRTLQLNNSFSLKGNTELVQSQDQTVITSFPVADFGSAKLLIQVYDPLGNKRQVSELLIIHDGTTASATEYALISTDGEPLATYDVDIDSTAVVVLASAQTSNLLEYKISETLILA